MIHEASFCCVYKIAHFQTKFVFRHPRPKERSARCQPMSASPARRRSATLSAKQRHGGTNVFARRTYQSQRFRPVGGRMGSGGGAGEQRAGCGNGHVRSAEYLAHRRKSAMAGIRAAGSQGGLRRSRPEPGGGDEGRSGCHARAAGGPEAPAIVLQPAGRTHAGRGCVSEGNGRSGGRREVRVRGGMQPHDGGDAALQPGSQGRVAEDLERPLHGDWGDPGPAENPAGVRVSRPHAVPDARAPRVHLAHERDGGFRQGMRSQFRRGAGLLALAPFRGHGGRYRRGRGSRGSSPSTFRTRRRCLPRTCGTTSA